MQLYSHSHGIIQMKYMYALSLQGDVGFPGFPGPKVMGKKKYIKYIMKFQQRLQNIALYTGH